jgi:hypothetical protein
VSEIRDVNKTVHSVIRPGFMTGNLNRGITLIEVALVLGVSALILGLVLQGQSLIASSRVRWVMTFGEKVQTAVFAFQDRYRVMPGDYANATQSIRGVSFNGNGNGRIEVNSDATSAPLTPFESLLAWNHLSQAGFLAESYTFDPDRPAVGLAANVWGGYADIAFDSNYGDPASAGTVVARHNLKTGNYIPAVVLLEVDRKLDDGNALTGRFQFSNKAWAGEAPLGPGAGNGCVAASGEWALQGSIVNCGGAWLL